ncbi:MAG TPA: Ni/Fe-hydrogenase cytochrome b subunit [Anaerolineales bacterium]
MKMQIAVNPRLRPNIGPVPAVLLGLMGIGAVVALIRFIFGIGAISNLSNAYPWGFWISFDIFTGIAISSGAFLLAATVYILDIKEFRPLLLPSILTALLGYIMEVLALMVDLGRPERIWHMMIYQNFTSNMLLVGLCVMIYLAILAVEFAPTFFDGVKLPKWAALARRFTLPAVILGVVISTIHQGSLGSLLLIQPAKLHPLWWTPMLPINFFLSSIPIGLAMVIFESSMSSRYFHRGIEIHLLEKLARAIPFALGFYLLVRFVQLGVSGDFQYLFTSGRLSLLFWLEISIGSVIPLVLFSFKRIRQNPSALLAGAVILLVGMILNRFDVSWLGIHRLTNVSYAPSLMELSISAAIFSFGIFAFGLAARYLPLFEGHAEEVH